MQKITPRNKEQEEAIAKGIEFIEKGNPDEWLIIGGKAGTGKTTIAQAILEPYIGKKTILVCALSHKAKLVITEKIEAAFGPKKVTSRSIAGALGMSMDQETGRFQPGYDSEPVIKKAKIIVVDEASMINEDIHELIMKEKQSKAKVIFLGDIRQLPPIRENDDVNSDKPSPVFTRTNYIVLKERIRQGEESPILPFADFFGDNSRLTHPQADPVKPEARTSVVNEKGALVFCKNIYEVVEEVLPLFKLAVEKKEPNLLKIVTYRNEKRNALNRMVREQIFGGEDIDEYLPGDLLMFQDNYDVIPGLEPISNSYEIQVLSARKIEKEYKLWEIEFVYEGKPIVVEVIQDCDKKRHAADVSKLFEIAKKLPKGTERKEALSKAWALKNRYAPVEHAYAITSHKSQGSTYSAVVVDEMDIMSVSKTKNRAKSQSMYTAITRASHACIVVDGRGNGDLLAEAINLALKKL